MTILSIGAPDARMKNSLPLNFSLLTIACGKGFLGDECFSNKRVFEFQVIQKQFEIHYLFG